MKSASILSLTIVLSLAALACGGCAASSPAADTPSAPPAPAAGAPVPDTSLGLARGSVFDVPTPPAVKPNETSPGEQPVIARPYAIAPPLIPHGIADFMPITRKENACVGCHEVKEKKAGEPTPLPSSHYTDYRNAPDRVGTDVAGARYVCLSCHVPRTDAPDLVENRFRP
jgi:cytochrome c-type protein NapB